MRTGPGRQGVSQTSAVVVQPEPRLLGSAAGHRGRWQCSCTQVCRCTDREPIGAAVRHGAVVVSTGHVHERARHRLRHPVPARVHGGGVGGGGVGTRARVAVRVRAEQDQGVWANLAHFLPHMLVLLYTSLNGCPYTRESTGTSTIATTTVSASRMATSTMAATMCATTVRFRLG